MNHIEQEHAIAIASGWKYARIEKAACGGDVYENVWFSPGYEPFEQTADWIASNGHINPPRYTSDRNAIHQALRHLDDDDWLSFMMYLCDELGIMMEVGRWHLARRLMEATPDQMAKALLVTLELWKDD